jgi:hypothetical protein
VTTVTEMTVAEYTDVMQDHQKNLVEDLRARIDEMVERWAVDRHTVGNHAIAESIKHYRDMGFDRINLRYALENDIKDDTAYLNAAFESMQEQGSLYS